MIKTGLIAAAMAIALMATPAYAADYEIENTFSDALYGGGLGVLVGGALMLISGNPQDHWNYLTIGAGVGVIGGVGYGLMKSSGSLATLEDGKVKLAMPTPQIKVHQIAGDDVLSVSMDLVSTQF
jgi:opacity protein-like surface antigen